MRETVAEFERRTGLRYAPPESVTKIAQLGASGKLGRVLSPDDAAPTLFRFPGPCGLLEHFLDGLIDERSESERRASPKGERAIKLAPVPELWAADRAVNSEARGAAAFGTLVLLQPLRHDMVETKDAGIWVGVNRAVDPDTIVWLPPSLVDAAIPWDRIAHAEEAREALGPTDREREDVLASLSRYVEELLAVTKAAIGDPQVRWCDRPAEERQKLLQSHGVAPHWTPATP